VDRKGGNMAVLCGVELPCEFCCVSCGGGMWDCDWER